MINPEIKDSERTVLKMTFKNGDILYLNSGSHCSVSDPYYATRYAPLDENFPKRKESQDIDRKWMENSVNAKIEFAPFLEEVENHKLRNKDN